MAQPFVVLDRAFKKEHTHKLASDTLRQQFFIESHSNLLTDLQVVMHIIFFESIDINS